MLHLLRFVVAFGLLLPLFVLPAVAQQPLSSPRLTELLAEQEVLLSEAEELGGSRLPADAIVNSQGEIYELRRLTQTYEEVAAQLAVSQDELLQMHRDAMAMKTAPGGSAEQKGARKTFIKLAKQLLSKAAKRVASVVGYVADAGEAATLTYLKRQTVATLYGYIQSGQLKQEEVTELLVAAYQAGTAEEASLERLVEIQQRTRTIAGEVAVERKRLADLVKPATDDANLTPDLDPEGDEEERKKHNEEGVQPAGNVVEITWRRDDLGLNSIDTYVCPPNPDRQFSSDSLVGTDRYLTKSPVCVAAAHAGLFSVELGGRLRLIPFAGTDADEYFGSERNGIKSGSWKRNWGGFSVAMPH